MFSSRNVSSILEARAQSEYPGNQRAYHFTSSHMCLSRSMKLGCFVALNYTQIDIQSLQAWHNSQACQIVHLTTYWLNLQYQTKVSPNRRYASCAPQTLILKYKPNAYTSYPTAAVSARRWGHTKTGAIRTPDRARPGQRQTTISRITCHSYTIYPLLTFLLSSITRNNSPQKHPIQETFNPTHQPPFHHTNRHSTTPKCPSPPTS